MSVKTALLLIDIQLGFVTSPLHWGPSRSNPSFETNTAALLSSYRKLFSQSPTQHKLIHIAHSSLLPESPLHPSKSGFAFQPFVQPLPEELVLTKNVNSSFIGTDLSRILKEHFGGRAGKLYILGLSTDHCVNTTVRMAGNLGAADGEGGEKGEVVLIEDATAAWKKGDGDEFFEAEIVHRVHVESLTEFASVKKTKVVLGEWEGLRVQINLQL